MAEKYEFCSAGPAFPGKSHAPPGKDRDHIVPWAIIQHVLNKIDPTEKNDDMRDEIKKIFNDPLKNMQHLTRYENGDLKSRLVTHLLTPGNNYFKVNQRDLSEFQSNSTQLNSQICKLLKEMVDKWNELKKELTNNYFLGEFKQQLDSILNENNVRNRFPNIFSTL